MHRFVPHAALLAFALIAGVSSRTHAQPGLDSLHPGRLEAGVYTPPEAPEVVSPSRPTLLGAQQRLTLWEIERHRAELERLWSERPSFVGSSLLLVVGGSSVVIAALDTLRRSLRSSWYDDWEDDHDEPFYRSLGAQVAGGVGAALVVTGLLFWIHDTIEKRRVMREIRRVEGLLGSHLRDGT